jgi:hypothetical protein
VRIPIVVNRGNLQGALLQQECLNLFIGHSDEVAATHNDVLSIGSTEAG